MKKQSKSLSFYDVKSKKKFSTSTFKIVKKKKRHFAVAKSKSGSHECWRVISKVDYDKFK